MFGKKTRSTSRNKQVAKKAKLPKSKKQPAKATQPLQKSINRKATGATVAGSASGQRVVNKRVDKKKPPVNKQVAKTKKDFPSKFPFWARLKINKKHPTLVIDEENVYNKKSKKIEDSFVHREATHTYKSEYEELSPNPDKADPKPIYLKRPRKRPKREFEPNNKHLDMPQHLIERYSKNNKNDN